MSGGSSVVFWNQSNRKPAFFRGSIVETTRPIRSDRATRPRWRCVSTQRLGPEGATTICSCSNDENQAASAFVECETDSTTSEARMISVRNFTARSRASSGKAQGTTIGAEVVQDAYLVGKDPLAGSRSRNKGRCNPPEASRVVGADSARSGAPIFEILVLRPTEVPWRQQLLVSMEEPDRHVRGQCQRQSSRVARDAREPGTGEGLDIDIDAGAGRRPRNDRLRKTQVKTPFSGPASGLGPGANHPVSEDDSTVPADRAFIDLSRPGQY